MTRRVLFILDSLLLVLLLLLLTPRLTEIALHEWLGLVLVPPFFLHLLLSWPWIKTTTLGLGHASMRTRINYAINLSFFVLVVIATLSGLFISRVAVPFLSTSTLNFLDWHLLHNRVLIGLRVVIFLHVAMNWTWIANTLKKFGEFANSKAAVLGGPEAVFKRLGILLLVSAGVTLLTWWLILPLDPAIDTIDNPFDRFDNDRIRGTWQFLRRCLTLAVLVFISRRFLKVRL